jgi:predicted RNase H-like nuclease (RuvC/YqgF family)
MSDKERLEKFESYLNEFEHACRGGDYEASEHLKTLIIQTIEQQQQEITRLSRENIDLQRHIARQETDISNLEMENGRLKKLANLIIEESRWGNVETALEKVVSIAKRMVEGEE